MSLRLRTTLLMSADAILIALAYGLAVLIRFGEVPTLARLAGFTPVVAAAAVIGAALLWIYDTHRDLYRPLLDTVAAVLIACGVATLLTLAVPYALRLTAFPRSVFVLALPVQVVLLVAARLPWVFADRRRVMQQRIVVVGHDPDLARAIAAAVRLQMGAPKVDCACGSELEQLATGPRPDLLILAPDLSAAQREELHTWCAFSDVACLIVPKLEDLLCARARVGRIGDFPTLEARRPVLTPDHALIKRLLDLLGAIALGIACLPVALACAAAIKVTEPRAPVLYRQRRVGLNGRVFM
ncbi:MAG TPA: sugar transferase, partial [Bacillota bacterium]